MKHDDRGRPDAVLVAGPTASGKSALAMRLARELAGTVVNADSMQVYDGLRVVTARPSLEDEAAVPHALYGHVDPPAAMSVAEYIRQVEELLPRLRETGSVPIFTGGTGLYFQALVEGLSAVPSIDADIRAAVRELDASDLHRALVAEDAEMAATLRATDTQRLARALEVVRSTGTSLKRWQGETVSGPLGGLRLQKHLVMPSRPVLHERIADRARKIVANPLATKEIDALLKRDPELQSLAARAIGVAEIAAFLAGELTEDEATEALTVATRRYAKRQCTWFNNRLDDGWTRRSGADG